jgi:hypothetical protein
VGSADPQDGDHGDAPARADLSAGRRAVATRDAPQHDVHAGVEGAGAHAVDDEEDDDDEEVFEARGRREEGRRHEEAHDREEDGFSEVPEADRRREEGGRHEEADRTEVGDHPEAHDGPEGSDQEAHDRQEDGFSEVPEADRRREEGGRDAEAPDRSGQEGVVQEAHRHISALPVSLVAIRGRTTVAGSRRPCSPHA